MTTLVREKLAEGSTRDRVHQPAEPAEPGGAGQGPFQGLRRNQELLSEVLRRPLGQPWRLALRRIDSSPVLAKRVQHQAGVRPVAHDQDAAVAGIGDHERAVRADREVGAVAAVPGLEEVQQPALGAPDLDAARLPSVPGAAMARFPSTSKAKPSGWQRSIFRKTSGLPSPEAEKGKRLMVASPVEAT